MEAAADTRIPDTIEPIRGWKALRCMRETTERLVYDQPRATAMAYTAGADDLPPMVPLPIPRTVQVSVPVLVSPQQLTRWPERKALRAQCKFDGLGHGRWVATGFDVPSETCTCGVYAVDEPWQALPYLGADCVLCEVEGYGKVIRGAKGWRAEKARIVSLTTANRIDAKTLERLTERYSVPLVQQDELIAPLNPNTFAGQAAALAAAFNQLGAAVAQTTADAAKAFNQLALGIQAGFVSVADARKAWHFPPRPAGFPDCSAAAGLHAAGGANGGEAPEHGGSEGEADAGVPGDEQAE